MVSPKTEMKLEELKPARSPENWKAAMAKMPTEVAPASCSATWQAATRMAKMEMELKPVRWPETWMPATEISMVKMAMELKPVSWTETWMPVSELSPEKLPELW